MRVDYSISPRHPGITTTTTTTAAATCERVCSSSRRSKNFHSLSLLVSSSHIVYYYSYCYLNVLTATAPATYDQAAFHFILPSPATTISSSSASSTRVCVGLIGDLGGSVGGTLVAERMRERERGNSQ